MYLLDTNVLSELRKLPLGRTNEAAAAWARTQPSDGFYISVVSVLELESGIVKRERSRPEEAVTLRLWLDEVILGAQADRILTISMDVAVRCGRLTPAPQDTPDALIAATALVHGLTVVTRNTSDFAPMGVTVFNPWAG